MSKFHYAAMFEKQDALERLDLRFPWGRYDLRVLRFHLTAFQPGRPVGFHKHDEFEFHFIPKGRGIVIMNDRTYPLRDGLFYLTGPGLMHYQEADVQDPMLELCLHIDIVERQSKNHAEAWEVQEAEACIHQLRNLPAFPTHDLYEAMPHFLEAYEAVKANIPGLLTTLKQHVIQILLKAARAYDSSSKELPRTELPSRDMKAYRYRLALQYIQANYAGVMTIEDIAEKINISPRQLQRVFKEMNPDMTFRELLEQVRLEAVCRMLAETSLPVNHIASSAGFSSSNYLHAVFRRRFGVTPAEYRKINQAQEEYRNV